MIYGQHIGRTSPGRVNPVGDAAATTGVGGQWVWEGEDGV